MKFLRIAVVILIVFGFTSTNAQTKVGHINTTELIKIMPSFIKAQKEIEKLNMSHQNVLTELVTTYRSKVDEYNNLPDTTMPLVMQTKAYDIKQTEERINNYKKAAEEEVAAKETELLTPIFNEIKTAINAVAKEHGYDYIMNIETEEMMLPYRSVLFYNDKNDVTVLVKKKLGIE